MLRGRLSSLLRDFGGTTRRLWTNQGGLSAIEFALLLPVMLIVYLGTVDVSLIITADRKVTNIASAVGDLVGQATQISDDDIADIFQAAETIIEPLPNQTLSIVVTSVVADENNATTVDWSEAHNGSAAAGGSAITVPPGLTEPNSSVIVATVSYTYASPASEFLTGEAITLDETFYLRPRRTTQVARVD
jgi:Flp pilus assembly protein TadG